MTIWFIPQRFLTFINAYRELLRRYDIPFHVFYNAGRVLFNRLTELGMVGDTGQVKLIINEQADFYPYINDRISEYTWNVEQRPPSIYEISEFYEAMVLAVELFVQDLYIAQSRAMPRLAKIQQVNVTELGGTIHV